MSNQNTLGREGSAQKSPREQLPTSMIDWLKLVRDRRWSTAQKWLLLEQFPDPAEIYTLETRKLRTLVRGKWQAEHARIDNSWLDADQKWLNAENHNLLVASDPGFPALLRQLNDPPIALFTIGQQSLLSEPSVAIVGSRKPTPAGRRMAEQTAEGLAKLGIVVVSGMALGIDGAAHHGALHAGEPTVAVMGCGLDTIYPARHRHLFEEISKQGCIISEYPLGMQASRYTFPQRNRLVSGLSLGVIVVEAAERSGTLITARLAAEQNRSVMVVPGSPLSRQYAGSHRLIQDGAALVTRTEDVLVELQVPLQNIVQNTPPSMPSSTRKEPHHSLLEHIFRESTSVDDIISTSGLTAAKVSSMLLMLEVENAIALADDGGYVKLVQ